METIIVNIKKTFKFDIKSKIKFISRDIMFIYLFIAINLKNIMFIGVLRSLEASKLSINFDKGILSHLILYFLFSLIFISFTFLMHRKTHLWSLVVVNTIYTIFVVGDLWHYRAFGSFISLHLLKETQNLTGLGHGVMSMSRPIDLIFIVDVLIMIIISIKLRDYYKDMQKVKGTFTILFLVPFFIILVYALNNFSDAAYKGNYTLMRNISPIGYHFYDAVAFIDDNRSYKLSQKDNKEIKEWYKVKNENLKDNEYSGIFKGKNLIIIQVESLENFVVGQKYEGQEITPTLNKLLDNSLYFPNYFEQVNNGTSSDADLMTNASLYPIRRGSTFFRYPKNDYITLPKMLEENGYTTKALHSDHGFYWNVKNALINFGFNQFMDEESFPVKKFFWMGLTDECFFDQSSTILENTKQPFYAFNVTITSHMPFKLPPNFRNLKFDNKFDKTYLGGYFQSINYTDRQIGKFLNNLDQKGILDNSVVVIYGDHTSIHKYYSDKIKNIKPQEEWWDNGKRVPLIIYSKNMQGRKINTIGGQIDLLPTIAYTLGIDKSKYENSALGRNLLNTNESFALLNDGTIVGKKNLSKAEVKHIKESYKISDEIIRSDYFKNNVKGDKK